MPSKTFSAIFQVHPMYYIKEGVGDVRFSHIQLTFVNPSKNCFEYLGSTRSIVICDSNDDMYESQTGDEYYFFNFGLDRYYIELDSFHRDNKYLRMLHKGVK